MKREVMFEFGDGSLHSVACVEPVSECVRAEMGLPSGHVRVRTADGFGIVCERGWLDAKCKGWRGLLRAAKVGAAPAHAEGGAA